MKKNQKELINQSLGRRNAKEAKIKWLCLQDIKAIKEENEKI